MGTSRNFYVGPYIKCLLREVSKTHATWTCANKQCANRNKSLTGSWFCAICGTACESVEEVVSGFAPDKMAVDEMIGEVFFSPRISNGPVHLWLPNQHRGERAEVIRARNDLYECPIRNEDIEKDRQWIRVEYEKELDIFRAEYGMQNVHLCWGRLVYNL